jgi:hypothetical protein
LFLLDVAPNLGILPVYVHHYVHAGLAPVANIARTPSFVMYSLKRSVNLEGLPCGSRCGAKKMAL